MGNAREKNIGWRIDYFIISDRINNKIEETYIYDKYEIVLEMVKDLGVFMEVEHCTTDDVDIKSIKNNIQKFIDNLNISVSNELNYGKPEMFIKKHNIKI